MPEHEKYRMEILGGQGNRSPTKVQQMQTHTESDMDTMRRYSETTSRGAGLLRISDKPWTVGILE
jgi:hypothetical protein